MPVTVLESGYTVLTNKENTRPNKASVPVGKEDSVYTPKTVVTDRGQWCEGSKPGCGQSNWWGPGPWGSLPEEGASGVRPEAGAAAPWRCPWWGRSESGAAAVICRDGTGDAEGSKEVGKGQGHWRE